MRNFILWIGFALSITNIRAQETTLTIYPACVGSDNGSVVIQLDPRLEAEGYIFPFIGEWDNDEHGQAEDFEILTPSYTITNLPADSYDMTIRLSDECTIFASFVIPVLTFTIHAQIQDVSCGQDNGSLQVSVIRDGLELPEGKFDVVWHDDPSIISSTRSNLSAGTYCATISSMEEPPCTLDTCFQIWPYDLEIFSEDSDCKVANGYISILPDPDLDLSTISWTVDDVAQPLYDGMTTLSDIAGGEYCYSIEDGDCLLYDCMQIDRIMEDGLVDFTIYPFKVTQDYGGGASVASDDGSLFDITWTDIFGRIIQEATAASDFLLDRQVGEQYCVEVVNEGGCVWNTCFTVPGSSCAESYRVYIDDVTSPSSPISADGTLSIHITGESDDCQSDEYIVSWDNGDLGSTLTQLDPGQYCATISLAPSGPCSDCVMIVCFDLHTLPSDCPTLSRATAQLYQPSCEGADGSIVFDRAPIGAPGEHYYKWSDASGQRYYPDNSFELHNIPADIYYLDVIDGSGCTHRVTINLTPAPLDIVEKIEPACDGQMNGLIHLELYSETSDYDVTWDHGVYHHEVNESTLRDLAPGTYCADFHALDGSCDYRACYEVPGATEGDLSLEVIRAQYCDRGGTNLMQIQIHNGVSPYQIHWRDFNSLERTEPLISRYVPGVGTYCVDVIDHCGQRTSTCVDVREIQVDFAPTPGCADDGQLDISISNAFAPYRVKINRGAWVDYDDALSTISLTDVSSGEYCVSVWDRYNCIYTKCYEFKNKDYQIIDTEPSCKGLSNGSLTVRVNNPSGDPITVFMNSAESLALIFNDEIVLSSLPANDTLDFLIRVGPCEYRFEHIVEEVFLESVYSHYDGKLCHFQYYCKGDPLEETFSRREPIPIGGYNDERNGHCYYTARCEFGGSEVGEVAYPTRRVKARAYQILLTELHLFGGPLADVFLNHHENLATDGACIDLTYCTKTYEIETVHGFGPHGPLDGVALNGNCIKIECGLPSTDDEQCFDELPGGESHPVDNCQVREFRVIQLLEWLSQIAHDFPQNFPGSSLENFLLEYQLDNRAYCATARYCVPSFEFLYSDIEMIDCTADFFDGMEFPRCGPSVQINPSSTNYWSIGCEGICLLDGLCTHVQTLNMEYPGGDIAGSSFSPDLPPFKTERKISPKAKNEVKLYPDPASNHLIIEDTGHRIIEKATIYASDGSLIKDLYCHLQQITHTIDLSTFAQGGYFIKIIYKNGTQEVQKFIKL